MKPRSLSKITLAVIAALVASSSVQAATFYYDGGTASYAAPASFSSDAAGTTDPLAVPAIGDDVIFNTTPSNALANTVSLNGNQAANSLTFNTTGASTFSVGTPTTSTLTVGAGGLNKLAGSGTVNFPGLTLGSSFTVSNAATSAFNFGTVTGSAATGTTQTFTVVSAGNNENTIASLNNGTLGGNVALVVNTTVNGSFGLDITGASNFTGGTTVNQGRIRLRNVGGLGTGPVTIAAGTGGNGGQVFIVGGGTNAYNMNIAGTGTSEAAGRYGALRFQGATTLGTATNTLNLTAAASLGGANNTTTVASIIIGSGPLTFDNNATTGTAQFTVTNANTYTGGTTVTGIGATGVTSLVLSTAGATLGTGNVTITGGALTLTLSTGVLNGIADSATLTLAGGGTAGTADRGAIVLNNGNETVGGLILGGTLQNVAVGTTFGATGSGAAVINDEYFGGTGVLTVVPEPSTWAMMLGGLAILGTVQYRRRRQS